MPAPSAGRPLTLVTRRVALTTGVLAAATLAACTSPPSTGTSGGSGGSGGPSGAASAGGSASGSTGSTGSAGQPTQPTDVATGLRVPWSGAVLPDGSVLVSERDSGQVKRVAGGAVSVVGTVDGVQAAGEGGLLGIAVDEASVATRPVLYAYLTASGDNRVVTVAMDGARFGAQAPILTGIPKGATHNGGRLAFGPDGFLYVTTGETGQRGLAQDLASLGGKILRVTTDGQPAPGNPFPGSRVWSYGHRNVQGIAWTASGQMWASEFGQDTWDELNVITPGQNYGWPTVEGVTGRAGFVDPVRQWPTSEASPSGLCIGPDGSVLMAALRGQGLWKIPLTGDGQTGSPQKLLDGQYGRLRDVFVGPDGLAWVLTNNTSRGTPRDGDDRLVRLPRSVTG